MVVSTQTGSIKEIRHHSKHDVVELSGRDTIRDELSELIGEQAGKLIREALEAEVSELSSRPFPGGERRGEDGSEWKRR